MPEMDGYRVAELIITTEKYFFESMKLNSVESVTKSKRHCPIVAITANCDETVREKALRVGIVRVLPKPMTEEMMD